jgi:serine/threonine protein kinase
MPNSPQQALVSEDPAAQWIGREIDGRYRILELLAEGGMGAVFIAEHVKLHKQVALKTIKTEFAANHQAEGRFAREALATGQIDHPHVVSAIDYGQLPEGGMYLVIQLIRGENLNERIARGVLPWQQVCLLGSQIADALAAAHAIGIVHRDLKPENILLERRSDAQLHARVVDFGIARVSEEMDGMLAGPGQPLTRTGAVIGTPGYMPPEQAVGAPIDFRVDLYALGVILWECCTGKFLWEGESLAELCAIQLAMPAPSLRDAGRNVPTALAALVDRLLARNPADRPASAAEVRDELRRLAMRGELAAVAGVARPVTMVHGSSNFVRPAEAAQAVPAAVAGAGGQSRALWAVAALLVLLIALVGWFGVSAKL